ncbi:transcriptional regulator BetI [Veronia nyctiphanis]|uniref:HTH-type transcriptional regulator BetI n=1 Tax=Veronia nyctiphanis TaxID=1278244 RepID=A0A4Q0YM16_9GAMM|nr:transcriptional regulator BetI [Veronia nyctiphanis]RXJ71872.1 transcriptional regulator BetI [Veronia nyctiphanis]
MPKVGMPDIRKPQLVRATMAVIDRVGLHGASISLISKEAGVSTGIINHYFGGKDGLLEETMREVLRQLSKSVSDRLRKLPKDAHRERINAIVSGNFDGYQTDNKVAKTWLAFWAFSMHNPELKRLQHVNEKRLLSHLKRELKALLPQNNAELAALGVAALIDGIWLRGTLNPSGIDLDTAKRIINDYLNMQLSLTPHTH